MGRGAEGTGRGRQTHGLGTGGSIGVTGARAVVLGTVRAGREAWAFGRRARATIVGVASPRSRAVSAGEKPQAARSHGLSATAPLSRRPAGSLGPPPAASSGASIGRRRPRPPGSSQQSANWRCPLLQTWEMHNNNSALDCDKSPRPLLSFLLFVQRSTILLVLSRATDARGVHPVTTGRAHARAPPGGWAPGSRGRCAPHKPRADHARRACN